MSTNLPPFKHQSVAVASMGYLTGEHLVLDYGDYSMADYIKKHLPKVEDPEEQAHEVDKIITGASEYFESLQKEGGPYPRFLAISNNGNAMQTDYFNELSVLRSVIAEHGCRYYMLFYYNYEYHIMSMPFESGMMEDLTKRPIFDIYNMI